MAGDGSFEGSFDEGDGVCVLVDDKVGVSTAKNR